MSLLTQLTRENFACTMGDLYIVSVKLEKLCKTSKFKTLISGFHHKTLQKITKNNNMC